MANYWRAVTKSLRGTSVKINILDFEKVLDQDINIDLRQGEKLLRKSKVNITVQNPQGALLAQYVILLKLLVPHDFQDCSDKLELSHGRIFHVFLTFIITSIVYLLRKNSYWGSCLLLQRIRVSTEPELRSFILCLNRRASSNNSKTNLLSCDTNE